MAYFPRSELFSEFAFALHYGLTHVRVPIFGNKKGDITSLNQLGILGELFSEFAFALHSVGGGQNLLLRFCVMSTRDSLF